MAIGAIPPVVSPSTAGKRGRLGNRDTLPLPAKQHHEPFTLTLVERDRWFWNKFVELTFDGRSGAQRHTRSSVDAGWLEKLNLLMVVLHFNHLGGALMKWLGWGSVSPQRCSLSVACWSGGAEPGTDGCGNRHRSLLPWLRSMVAICRHTFATGRKRAAQPFAKLCQL